MNKILYFFLIFNTLTYVNSEEDLLQNEESIFEDIKEYYNKNPTTVIIGTIAGVFVIVSIFILYVTHKEDKKDVRNTTEPKAKLKETPIKKNTSYLHYYVITACIVILILMYLPKIITVFNNLNKNVKNTNTSSEITEELQLNTNEENNIPLLIPTLPGANQTLQKFLDEAKTFDELPEFLDEAKTFGGISDPHTSMLMIIIQTILSLVIRLVIPVVFYVMTYMEKFFKKEKLQEILQIISIDIKTNTEKYNSSIFISTYFVYTYYLILIIIDIFFIDILNTCFLVVLCATDIIINIIGFSKNIEDEEENYKQQYVVDVIFDLFVLISFLISMVTKFYTLYIFFYISNIFVIFSLLSTFDFFKEHNNEKIKHTQIFFSETYNEKINCFSFLICTIITYMWSFPLYIPFLINILLFIFSFIKWMIYAPKEDIQPAQKLQDNEGQNSNVIDMIKIYLNVKLLVIYPYYLFYKFIISLDNLKNIKKPLKKENIELQ